jgi:hypothetical protein
MLCLRAFPDIAQGQVRDGILGHPWGTPVASVAEPLELHTARFEGNLMFYATGLREIGDAQIDQCEVEFVRGGLAGVIVTTRGTENSRRLLSLLQKEYGEGTARNTMAHTWVTAETHVAFDLDNLGDAYVYWYSMRLQK